jgi:hypothetical protein
MNVVETAAALRRTADLLEQNPELINLGGISQIHTSEFFYLGYPGEHIGEFLQYLDYRGIEFLVRPEGSSLVIEVAGLHYWASKARVGADEDAMAVLRKSYDLTDLLDLPTPKSAP